MNQISRERIELDTKKLTFVLAAFHPELLHNSANLHAWLKILHELSHLGN